MSERASVEMVRLDRRSALSLHLQLYERIRQAIAAGQLMPGERLPSARSLAAQLGVARGTVDAAYGRLASEGYVVGQGPAGTVVSAALRMNTRRMAPPRRRIAGNTQASGPLPLRLGLPALDLFPRKLWTRLLAREARRLNQAGLAYPDPLGLSALRDAVAAYLSVSRGIACGPERIVVTGGYQAALNFAAALLLSPGDAVWFEDPGYRFARDALEGLGLRIAPVPVDGEGMMVAHGRRYFPRAKLALVTPAHQSPLGMSLSPPRRHALLDWAEEARAWVLEDDYDSEFHYSGFKPPALKSIDDGDRVFYAGSFSKTLFPGLRLGYLVVPASFTQAAAALCRRRDRGQASLEQSVAAAFMTEGHFARHLRRMRNLYEARRQALADALLAEFGSGIRLSLPPGGLHILARFDGAGSDIDMAARALKHGLHPSPLSTLSLKHGAGQGLLMSFTNIPEKTAPAIAAALARAIDA